MIIFYDQGIECPKKDVSTNDKPDKRYPNQKKYRAICYKQCKNNPECQFWAFSKSGGCR